MERKTNYLEYMSDTDFGEKLRKDFQYIFYGKSGEGYEEKIDALILEVWKAGYNSGIDDMKKALSTLSDNVSSGTEDS